VLVELERLFEIRSGDYHALKELGPGEIPLVSCGEENHGLVGRFDIPAENRHENAVTVAYNGAPLLAMYRPYTFGAKDDIGVLYPHHAVSELGLVYVAAALNALRWRYCYARKCFKGKLQELKIDVPVAAVDGTLRIDEARVRERAGKRSLDLRPPAEAKVPLPLEHSVLWSRRTLSELFVLERGDFHSLGALGAGDWTTVSRTTSDNGVAGRYERPDDSELYPAGTITVSTVGGDAFVQAEPFIVTDNVVVLLSRKPLPLASACLVAAMINARKWRYGYGRQCYHKKLAGMEIDLPWKDDQIDHAAAESIVVKHPYWNFVRKRMQE